MKIWDGAGVDLADYAASLAAVKIDLGAGTAAGGHAEGYTVAGIENCSARTSMICERAPAAPTV